MRDEITNQIFNELKSAKYGLTICNLMSHTGLARGTIKSYLKEMQLFDNVIEVNYSQNTIVYYAKGNKINKKSVNTVEVR